jgi:hypothetical protein
MPLALRLRLDRQEHAVGSILMNIPDIPDTGLVFNETETRIILKFFWPNQAPRIDGLTIDNTARRLAQTALIAAIDGTYAMGFVDALFQGVSRPSKSLKIFAKKMARSIARQYFRHATLEDLEDVRIYENVRSQVSLDLRHKLEMVINGVAMTRTPYALALLSQPALFRVVLK